MSRGLLLAVGQSDDVIEEDAVAEVLDACAAQLGDRRPLAGLLFASVDYNHQVIVDAIMARYPGLQLIGGTSDGEIASEHGYLEDSVTLVLFASDTLRFKAGLACGLGADPAAATAQAIAAASEGFDEAPAMCLLVPDGLTANASVVLRTLQAHFGASFPILGGSAGDHWEFSRCHQFCQDAVVEDGIPVLLVYGDIRMSVGVASGWVPVGRRMRVTDIDGVTLKEIDGRSAFAVFEEHFGEQMRSAFAEYPLAVYTGDSAEDDWHYLRAIFQADEETGHVILTAEIPSDATVSLTNVIRPRILDGARQSIAAALEAWDGAPPDGALIVSCAARKWLLGDQAATEFEVLRQQLQGAGVDVPMVGFYSFGEFGPIAGESRFHNETCISILLGAA